MPDIYSRVLERVEQLPDAVWDCERCQTRGSMQIRRSSLNPQFKADDIALKCSECRYFCKHGVPFEDPEGFRKEFAEMRNNVRTVDFAETEHGPEDSVEDNLRHLGYLGAAETE